MVSVREGFAPFIQCMRAEGLPDSVIRTFEHYYAQLAEGETGLIPETAIVPIDALPDAEEFPPELAEAGEAALSKTVLLKLNGGLGTSMGLDKAKSLLEVKNGLSFLDIIARQALHSGFPLVLMNSFSTRDDSLARLEQYPGLQGAVPLDFLQHKVPKITATDLTPVSWAADPLLEWCPPGHGDLYTALVTSGMLDTLLEADFEYAFVSNSDNLGAVLEPTILGFFAEKGFPFLMEVADRTPADKKGGHLARLPEGQLVLRESAQCPDGDLGAFQDIDRHRYFNTNNLWLHLPALKRLMVSRENVLSLPMICNRKTVDPRDGSSTPVYQLETAMGAAIAVFPGAGAIRVPRSRFAP
ncbi:MAG: UTP--glucose-1-phosphate uridylyltransferase, partial [Gammaproteobacteria bacterium]|nr:UTP--glucose-1-phosphate uridylyltransferase [Gammaproteobacteria bacterium]